MEYVFTKKYDGTFTMSWIGFPVSTDEISTIERDIFNFSIPPIKGIKEITGISDVVRGESDTHYFKKYFSYSNTRSGVSYSENETITGITQEYCPTNNLYLNLSYYRIDEDVTTIPTLTINTIVISGIYDIEETDEIIEVPNEGYILEPKDIYKIFDLTGFDIYGVNTDNIDIHYRFTQDSGRKYTTWEPLTTENISTIKLNPVRFAQVQYSIKKIDNNITSKIYDIILLGNFQNINNYYLKTNRYGVREDCSSAYTQISGNTSALNANGENSICLSGVTDYKGDGQTYNYNRDWFTKGLSCYLDGDVIGKLETENNTDENSEGAFDPYNSTKISKWYNFLANSTNKVLGWEVDYHLTDPDGNGIDRYLHEYQLFNIVDVQKIKVIVPENTFPDNQVQINEFMLDMMDTFQIIILKDEFHKAFGIDKRPSQKDILYLCVANRFYRVKHAQVKRDVMYSGVYYNVVLEKYEKLANEQNLSTASKNLIDPLTENTDLDSLFGFENKQEEKKIVSEQLKPTTHETYRLNLHNDLVIIKRDIFNGLKGTKVANNYYNLSTIPSGTTAVTYTRKDPKLSISDNRAFNLWFNFNNKYDPNKIIDDKVFDSYNIKSNYDYEFLDNHDIAILEGYRISYINKKIVLTLNDKNYFLDAPNLGTNIWYGLSISIDNRQKVIKMDLFKRNYKYNITMFNNNYQSVKVDSENTTQISQYISQGYKPVKNTEINQILTNTNLKNVASIEYSGVSLVNFDIDKYIDITASDMKLTNIRIFNDIIPDKSISNILLQRVIKEANYLILADNATKELYTDNIKNTRWV